MNEAIKGVVAVIAGFLSGFLIYMAAAMILTDGNPSSVFIWIVFGGGWALSVTLLLRGARTISKVFARAFLLGAAEWLAMIPVGFIFTSKQISKTLVESMSGAEMAGATAAAGVFSFLTGAVAVAMAVACLVGFTVAHLLGREMKPELTGPTKKCPFCAEIIKEEAKVCRYCGRDVAVSSEGEETTAKTKICPACQKEIPNIALMCKFCQAVLHEPRAA
jgi:hypothetical protein